MTSRDHVSIATERTINAPSSDRPQYATPNPHETGVSEPEFIVFERICDEHGNPIRSI